MVYLPGQSETKHTFEFAAPAIDGFRRVGLFGSVLVNGPEMSQDLHKSVEVHRFLPKINMIIYDFKTKWLVVYEKDIFEKCIHACCLFQN